MQISKINFNFQNPNLKPQKYSNLMPAKVSFMGQNKDTYTKSNSFSNEMALELLKTKLAECMTQEDSDFYLEKTEKICEELGIEPKNLPIDEDHRGNLTKDQRKQISFLVKEIAVSAQ